MLMRMNKRARCRKYYTETISKYSVRGLSVERVAEMKQASPVELTGWVYASARYGLVEAQVLLGQMLLDGDMMQRDHTAAFGWISAAAGASYPPAINMRGRCHQNGWGTALNATRACVDFRRAAELSDQWGQYNLGEMMLRGLGVERNRKDALSWLEKSARQGNAKAMNLLGRAWEEGWERPADVGMAAACYQKAAQQGCFRGQYNFGSIMVQTGKSELAAKLFDHALDSGSPAIVEAVIEQLALSVEPILQAVHRRACAMRDMNSPIANRVCPV